MQLPIRVENRETIEGFGLMAQASLPPIISQIIDFALFTTASRIDSAVLFFHAECFPKPERKSYITLEITWLSVCRRKNFPNPKFPETNSCNKVYSGFVAYTVTTEYIKLYLPVLWALSSS